ncbi:MAG: DUF2059 domain-containing protein [Rhizobiales bacterium]|nr:DUF2059 domain-containing protein [Hyphomicrobiales bacterium]
MRSFILLLILVSTLFLNLPLALAKDTQDRVADSEALSIARKLIEILVKSEGLKKTLKVIAREDWKPIAIEIKLKNPKINKVQLEELRAIYEEIQLGPMNPIFTQLPKIYVRYFSKEELIALYEFENSPLGRKLNKVTPKIIAEITPMLASTAASRAPGMYPLIKKRIKEKGFKM